ncbi:hypothetical protein Syun_009468 [Stephania yunnanensis]|uniref:Uncharacterized protein n=1 Tax=Stephania yunnanensis TaxID=152371 RepID=A0AAP0KGG2_9MAGN
MTAGAYDSGGPAAVDNTTPTMLGVAVVAHKGGRKKRKIYLGFRRERFQFGFVERV